MEFSTFLSFSGVIESNTSFLVQMRPIPRIYTFFESLDDSMEP